MRVVFGNWKYIFKNLWFVLPFVLVPAVFFALSIDQTAIKELAQAFFTGEPQVHFFLLFRVWSVIRVDHWMGAVLGVGAVATTVIFATVMLSLVEKHMRIGKRTFSGAFSQLGNFALIALLVAVVYLALYELWALVISAVLFLITALNHLVVVYLLYVLAFLIALFVLFYVATIFFLWLPCMQITGFRPYDAFLYAYRLMIRVRRKLIAAFALSFFVGAAVLCGAAFLPVYVFLPIAFVVCVFLLLGFCIRMETVYFYTDKLDREDLIRSYREL